MEDEQDDILAEAEKLPSKELEFRFADMNPYWYRPVKKREKVVIQFMRHMESMWRFIVERVYQVEQIACNDSFSGYATGDLTFHADSFAGARKDNGAFHEVSCFSGVDTQDRFIYLQGEFTISIIRHNPAHMIIYNDLFDREYIKVTLTDFYDCLHYESIEDYQDIVKIGQKRIKEAIKSYKHDELHFTHHNEGMFFKP